PDRGARPEAFRDHRGLRATFHPFDRPAAQGRPEDRSLPADRPGRRAGRPDTRPAIQLLDPEAGPIAGRPAIAQLATAAGGARYARSRSGGRLAGPGGRREVSGLATEFGP